MSRLEQEIEDIIIDLFEKGPTRSFSEFDCYLNIVERDFCEDGYTSKAFNHLFNRVYTAIEILLEVGKIKEREIPEMTEFATWMYVTAFMYAEKLDGELDRRDQRFFDDAYDKYQSFRKTLERLEDDLNNPRGRGRGRDDRRDDRRSSYSDRDRGGRDRGSRRGRDSRETFATGGYNSRERASNSGSRRRSNSGGRDREESRVPSMNSVEFLTTPSKPAEPETPALTDAQWALIDAENDRRDQQGRRTLNQEEAIRWLARQERQPSADESRQNVNDAKVWGLVEGAEPNKEDWDRRTDARAARAAQRESGLLESPVVREEEVVEDGANPIVLKYEAYLDQLQYVEAEDLTVRDQLALDGINIFEPANILARPQRNQFGSTGNPYHIGYNANKTKVVRMIDEDGYQIYAIRKLEMNPENHRFPNFSKPSISEPRSTQPTAVRNLVEGKTVTLNEFNKEQGDLAIRRDENIASWEKEVAELPPNAPVPAKPTLSVDELRINDKAIVVDDVIYGIGEEDADFRAHNHVIAKRAETGFISANYQYVQAALTPVSYDTGVDRDVLKAFTIEVAGRREMSSSITPSDTALQRMTELTTALRRAQSIPEAIWTYIERRYTVIINDILRTTMNATISIDSFYDDIKGLPEYMTGKYGEHFTTKFLEAIYDRIDRFGVILGDNVHIPGDMDESVRAGVTMGVEYKRVLHVAAGVNVLDISYEQTKQGTVIEFNRESAADVYTVSRRMLAKERDKQQYSNALIFTEDGYRLKVEASGMTRPWDDNVVLSLKSLGQFRY